MKEYALVYTNSGYVVMLYADWIEYPNGSVIQTSDDVGELQRDADCKNAYDRFMEEYSEYSEFDGSYKSL